MSLKEFWKIMDENRQIPCWYALRSWFEKHEKLDAHRERMFVEELNKNTELRKKQRAFIEWFESIPDIMDYMEEGSYPYEKKKKELLGSEVTEK